MKNYSSKITVDPKNKAELLKELKSEKDGRPLIFITNHVHDMRKPEPKRKNMMDLLMQQTMIQMVIDNNNANRKALEDKKKRCESLIEIVDDENKNEKKMVHSYEDAEYEDAEYEEVPKEVKLSYLEQVNTSVYAKVSITSEYSLRVYEIEDLVNVILNNSAIDSNIDVIDIEVLDNDYVFLRNILVCVKNDPVLKSCMIKTFEFHTHDSHDVEVLATLNAKTRAMIILQDLIKAKDRSAHLDMDNIDNLNIDVIAVMDKSNNVTELIKKDSLTYIEK